jgi:chromosome segregation ATPase
MMGHTGAQGSQGAAGATGAAGAVGATGMEDPALVAAVDQRVTTLDGQITTVESEVVVIIGEEAAANASARLTAQEAELHLLRSQLTTAENQLVDAQTKLVTAKATVDGLEALGVTVSTQIQEQISDIDDRCKKRRPTSEKPAPFSTQSEAKQYCQDLASAVQTDSSNLNTVLGGVAGLVGVVIVLQRWQLSRRSP